MDRRKFLIAIAGLGTTLACTSIFGSASAWAQTSTPRKALSSMTESGSQSGRKYRVFITGSSEGLGHATAKTLLDEGHDVVVHVRSTARLPAVKDLMDRGAKVTVGFLPEWAGRMPPMIFDWDI